MDYLIQTYFLDALGNWYIGCGLWLKTVWYTVEASDGMVYAFCKAVLVWHR